VSEIGAQHLLHAVSDLTYGLAAGNQVGGTIWEESSE
jgi:hypothetical protein